jgi:hypothetical protein
VLDQKNNQSDYDTSFKEAKENKALNQPNFSLV